MKVDRNCKILILSCLIGVFQVQCFKAEEKGISTNFKSHTNQAHIRNIVKRSNDWSKRISPPSSFETRGYDVAGSENIEVTSDPPRIIRRLRIQHGGKQSVETFKEVNPKNRPNGRLNKIVRIKKVRKKTTPEPVITTPEVMTMTRKPFSLPSTSFPKITFSSPYAHITVINKEIKNPKRKKKNNKKHKYHIFSTPPYDNESRKNGLIDDSDIFSKHQLETQAGAHRFVIPHSYSNYGRYTNMHTQAPRIEYKDMNLEGAGTGYFNAPKVNENYKKNANTMMAKGSLSLFTNEKILDRSFYPAMFAMNYKRNSPKSIYIPHENFKENQKEFPSSNKENLKESSSQLKEIISKSETSSTKPAAKFGDKVKTAKNETEEPSTNATLGVEEPTTNVPSLTNKIANKTDTPDVELETELISEVTVTPSPSPRVRAVTPQQERFPARFPSLLFGEQNAFSDPFFDSHDISSPKRPNIMSWNRPLSPFYGSDSSQNDGYFSNSEMQPYHSDLVSGFHHSPQLAFLRRSILDTYAEETTTSEPVTPFSLPKFEIPPIDFNDKGCQTVYKEVKTVPGEGFRSEVKNGKSFIMTRECVFPNGVPTTEQTKDVLSTETSVTTKTAQAKDKS